MSGSTGFKEDMLKEFLKGLNAGMNMFDKKRGKQPSVDLIRRLSRLSRDIS
jgi:hypothetical protein